MDSMQADKEKHMNRLVTFASIALILMLVLGVVAGAAEPAIVINELDKMYRCRPAAIADITY